MRPRTACLLYVGLHTIGLTGQSPAFEVASIKGSAPGGLGSAFGGLHHGTFHATNVPLRQVIAAAYGFSETRVIGPEWLDKSRFDIVAKAPAGIPDTQVKPMLQALLTERFRFSAHLELRDMPVYKMAIAKGGVKMPVFPARDRAPEHPNDDRNIRGFPMMRGALRVAEFADMIARVVNRPVIDETGLVDRYSIFLSYAPITPTTSDKVQDFGPPDIFIALQEQLGLKLESGRAKLEVVVVDRVERDPTEN